MAKSLNKIMEAKGFDEETRNAIHEAWESRVSELREEFAQRYEHDKSQIVEAVDNFISTKVAEEMTELAQDKQALAEQRVKYRRAVKEHAKLLDRFITEGLAKEIRELRADREKVSEHVSKLDTFITHQLAEELQEFHADKKALVEQKVKLAKEGRRQLAESKKKFIKESAAKIETVVNKVVENEIKKFRKDITAARENDFGRKIFEAFAGEYASTYLNENAEVRNLQDTLAQMKRELKEAKAEVQKNAEAKKLTESKLRVAEDKYVRKQKLDELMKPLGREKREIMADLLEGVPTNKLEESFNKYLPSLMEGKPVSKKKPLKETSERRSLREHTGDRKAPAKAEPNKKDVVELDEIRKLAGLS